MKKHKLLFGIGLFVATLLGALTISRGNAFAATKTWDGGGADDKFSTGANWDGDTAPANGDSLVFPMDTIFSGDCSADLTFNNDLDSNSITLSGISTSGAKPSGCYSYINVTGNNFKLSGDFSPLESYQVNLGVGILADGDITIKNAIFNYGEPVLDIGNHTVTVIDGVLYSVSGTGTLILDSVSQGGGGGGCLSLPYSHPVASDSPSFSGNIVVQGYQPLFVTSRANDIANKASSISFVGGNSGLYLVTDNGSDMTFNKDFTINGGSINVIQAKGEDCITPAANTTVNLSGVVTVGASTNVSLDHANLKFGGVLNGKDNLQVQPGGSGSVTYPDGSSVNSEMRVVTISKLEDCSNVYNAQSANNKVLVDFDCSESILGTVDYPFQVKGILGGTGKIGGYSKILAGGVIAPGHSPGTLTVGNIEWVEGGIYEFEIGKDGGDQIIANGTVTLGNGTLKVLRFEDYVPKANDVYTIIANDGSDALTGTFKDLPEGATFTNSDGGVYKISYKGGDGNDVTITVVTAPKVPNTGFAMLKNNPLLTLLATTGSALAIAFVARKTTIKKQA